MKISIHPACKGCKHAYDEYDMCNDRDNPKDCSHSSVMYRKSMIKLFIRIMIFFLLIPILLLYVYTFLPWIINKYFI